MSESADGFRVSLDTSRTHLSASVCVETLGGTLTPLLERGLSIPCQKIEVFSTTVDNQETIDIHVLQGDAGTVSDPTVITIGKFSVKGISHARAGVPQIQVCFSVDFIGRFQLSARDLSTGRDIEVSGLSGAGHPVPQVVPQARARPESEEAEAMEETSAADADGRAKHGICIRASIVRLDHAFHQISDTTIGPVWMPRERGSYLPVKVKVLNRGIPVYLTQDKIDAVLKERALGIKAGILVAMGLIAFVISIVCLHFLVDEAAYGRATLFGVVAGALWVAVVKVARREVAYNSPQTLTQKQLELAKEAALRDAAAARGVAYGWPELSRNDQGVYDKPKSGLFESSRLAAELEDWVADKDGRTYRRKGYRDGDHA